MPASQLTEDELQALLAFAKSGGVPKVDKISDGRQLAASKGCIACHSVNGNDGVGPSWQNLFLATRTLTDGSEIVADENYLRGSIENPNEQIVSGYTGLMPAAVLSEQELSALTEYIKSVKSE